MDTNTLPHVVEDTWMVGVCDRNLAKDLLEGKAPGTFLIRKTDRDNQISYVLSLVYELSVILH